MQHSNRVQTKIACAMVSLGAPFFLTYRSPVRHHMMQVA